MKFYRLASGFPTKSGSLLPTKRGRELPTLTAVQRFQPALYPLDTDPLSPCGFRQTAAVQTVADQKSLIFIRKEKQVVQQ